MSWFWLLAAATLALGTACTLGRLRALERERAGLARSVAAVGALTAAHCDLRRTLDRAASDTVGTPAATGTVGSPRK